MLDRTKLRKAAAAAAVGKGAVAAVAPGVAVGAIKRALGEQFENADDLRATAAYRRQIRATGIGLVAAGVAGYAMERVAQRRRDGG